MGVAGGGGLGGCSYNFVITMQFGVEGFTFKIFLIFF